MKISNYKKFTESAWVGKEGEKQSIKQINDICRSLKIDKYTIRHDGLIDVRGNVYISISDMLDELPIKFGIVEGLFDCSHNRLTSTKGFPIKAHSISLHHNEISTLLPCKENGFHKFQEEMEGWFECSHNKLATLEGSPKRIIGRGYSCGQNLITNLVGAPEYIGGYFNCSYNDNLCSLEGFPNYVRTTSDITACAIDDLRGFPEFFEGACYFEFNHISEVLRLFGRDARANLKAIYWLNEYDVINGNKIILSRLYEVFNQLQIDPPDNIEFRNYYLI